MTEFKLARYPLSAGRCKALAAEYRLSKDARYQRLAKHYARVPVATIVCRGRRIVTYLLFAAEWPSFRAKYPDMRFDD